MSKDRKGYGKVGLTPYGPVVSAHRYSYEYFIGPIPDDMLVCHRCDNPSCVNPKHLFLGESRDNTDDMSLKWRTRTKLTLEHVEAIRRDERPYRVIAAHYGLKSHKSISNIKNRKTFGLFE